MRYEVEEAGVHQRRVLSYPILNKKNLPKPAGRSFSALGFAIPSQKGENEVFSIAKIDIRDRRKRPTLSKSGFI